MNATQKLTLRVDRRWGQVPFVRLKEKNEKTLGDLIQSSKIKTILNSNVIEILPDHVLIREESGTEHRLQNNFVFIFAGGEMPYEMLKKVGVKFRT